MLEERVDELEAQVADPESDGQEDQPETDKSEVETLEDALTGWGPGRNPEEREERRESGLAVLEWVRDQEQPVKASDVKHALYDEHGVDSQTEQTWWEQTARAALSHAGERGYVDTSGRSYEWVGK